MSIAAPTPASVSERHIQARLFVVDAFTSAKYEDLKGNPAGVLISEELLANDVAEKVARTLGLPALAIISDLSLFNTGDYPYNAVDLPIAWLGPLGNFLPLCGHATMATSLVLFSKYANLNEIRYVSRAGIRILATRTGLGACIALPALPPPQPLQKATAEEVLAILNKACNLQSTDVLYMGESRSGSSESPNLLVEVKDTVHLQYMQMKTETLLELPYRGVWLIEPGPAQDPNVDMQTRVFFPSLGLPEDHVCGSAHTLFTPYWASRKALKIAGNEEVQLVSRQVSPRGGLLQLRWNKKWGDEGGICLISGEGLIQDMGEYTL